MVCEIIDVLICQYDIVRLLESAEPLGVEAH